MRTVTTLSLTVGLSVCLAAQARPGRTLNIYVIDV